MTVAEQAVANGGSHDLCRVRVIHRDRRIDVALASGVPIVDLIPDLVELLAIPDEKPGASPLWHLVHPVHGVLADEGSLSENGIFDGTTLLLQRDEGEGRPAVVEDVADAIGQSLAARARQSNRTLAVWAGGATVAISAPLLILSPAGDRLTAAAFAAVVAAALTLISAAVGGRKESFALAMALAIGGAFWAATAGALMALDAGRVPTTIVAAAILGVAVVSVVSLMRTILRPVASGMLLAAALIVPQCALFGRDGTSPMPVAAAFIVVGLGGLLLVPLLVPHLTGLTSVRDGEMEVDDLDQQIQRSRSTQTWATLALLIGLVPAGAALAIGADAGSLALLAVGTASLANRARRSAVTSEAVLLAILSAATTAVIVSALARRGNPELFGAVAGAGVAGITVLLMSVNEEPSATVRKALDVVDAGLIIASLPLALLVGGGFAVFGSAAG